MIAFKNGVEIFESGPVARYNLAAGKVNGFIAESPILRPLAVKLRFILGRSA